MAKNPGAKTPPSTDLDGWRQAIAEGRLKSLRLEHIAAAFQDLGPVDRTVRERLAKHLSDAITGILVKRVGQNRPNRGEDIILEVHEQIFKALLQPHTADGKALRITFGPRVIFRMKTAIANSLRAQVRPIPKLRGKIKTDDAEESLEEVAEAVDEAAKILDAEDREQPDENSTKDEHSPKEESPPIFVVDEADDDEIVPGKREYDPTLLDGVRDMDESIDEKRVLAAIPNYKKQLAFRLYMDDVPWKSDLGNSISKACGISDKTARKWIKEIEEELKQNKEAQELLKLKVGAKS